MPALKHLHTYQKVYNYKEKRFSKTRMRCLDPDCSHTHSREFLVGKRARCPTCLEPFILDSQILRIRTPHCEDCTRKYKKSKRAIVDAVIGEEVLKL